MQPEPQVPELTFVSLYGRSMWDLFIPFLVSFELIEHFFLLFYFIFTIGLLAVSVLLTVV